MLIKSGDFKKALTIYESLGNYKGAKSKCTEVRYLLAEQKEKTGDPVGVLEDYNQLGDYKDAKQRARLLLSELIKKEFRGILPLESISGECCLWIRVWH